MMEADIYARYGLLGLIVFALITFGPRLLDKMTTWAMKHTESEDRSDEKVTDAFVEELRGNRLERDAYRLEREQYLTEMKTLSAKIALLEQRLSDVIILVRDFDERMRLHMQSIRK
jgi:hypothetical protein